MTPRTSLCSAAASSRTPTSPSSSGWAWRGSSRPARRCPRSSTGSGRNSAASSQSASAGQPAPAGLRSACGPVRPCGPVRSRGPAPTRLPAQTTAHPGSAPARLSAGRAADKDGLPVDLFEHQAKELFEEYGVPVQRGQVAATPEEAREIAAGFAADGTPLVVVKAQVKVGGRGKAGGVKLADGPAEAEAKARQILGMDIKGHTVRKVLIARASDIAQEYYLSFLLDRAARTFVAICSVQGGVEIEEVAHTNPEAVARIPVDPLTGVDAAKAAEIIRAGGLPPEAAGQAAVLAERLWSVF